MGNKKWKLTRRIIGILMTVVFCVVAAVSPVKATDDVFENVAGTYTVRCSLPTRFLDGDRSTIKAVEGTLSITDATNETAGIIGTASLTLTNIGTVAVTGYVGSGTRPYIELVGSDTQTFLTLNGKVRMSTSGNTTTVTGISGTVQGFAKSSGGTLGDDPAGAAATWSTASSHTGTTSALLTQAAAAGSTYVQWTPQRRIYLRDLATMSEAEWGLWYALQDTKEGGPQLELRFTAPDNINPDGVGHVDVTLLTPTTGDGEWTHRTYNSTFPAMYYGNDPYDGTAFSDDTPETIATIEDSINAEEAMLAGDGYSASDWELTRVRVEVWEAGARTCYIDDVMIDGRVNSFEPVMFTGTFSAR